MSRKHWKRWMTGTAVLAITFCYSAGASGQDDRLLEGQRFSRFVTNGIPATIQKKFEGRADGWTQIGRQSGYTAQAFVKDGKVTGMRVLDAQGSILPAAVVPNAAFQQSGGSSWNQGSRCVFSMIITECAEGKYVRDRLTGAMIWVCTKYRDKRVCILYEHQLPKVK